MLKFDSNSDAARAAYDAAVYAAQNRHSVARAAAYFVADEVFDAAEATHLAAIDAAAEVFHAAVAAEVAAFEAKRVADFDAEQARRVAVAKANAAAFVADAAFAVDCNSSPWRFYDAAVAATAALDLAAAEWKQKADIAFDKATDGASLRAAADIARAAESMAKDARSARAEENSLYNAARYAAAHARVARQSFR